MESHIGIGIQAVLTTCTDIERCSLHMQHARDVYGWRNNTTANRVVSRGSVPICMADRKSVTLTEWRNSKSFQGKQGDAMGKEDWRAIPIGEECPHRGSYCPTWVQWYLARRMGKRSNHCIETRKASAGVPREFRAGTRAWGDALEYVQKSG
ncbi:hypothetical protein Acr_07g0016160 [Actinidia rufa]|uniref:Uncharacterized protein n=1 Tax=Actinidia rufa TaxID=165716 RepID=A0A7J0EYB6_9ERIC|nr:hypothetical protein Acr_07g0016160 [Actinidia rufa]